MHQERPAHHHLTSIQFPPTSRRFIQTARQATEIDLPIVGKIACIAVLVDTSANFCASGCANRLNLRRSRRTGANGGPAAPVSIQEHAYASPIWYDLV
jgi:hypothetical protein